MNRRGRGRSRDEVIWIFFQAFVKVSLLYHLFFKGDVFNNSFWKICIKIANHVEPGLNLLERSKDRGHGILSLGNSLEYFVCILKFSGDFF